MNYRQFAAIEGPFAEAIGGETNRALILLHGWGADGRDLHDLHQPLQQYLPKAALFTPHALHPCTANPVGRQWFDLTDRFFEDPASAIAEMDVMAGIITEMVQAVGDALSLPLDKIVLGGFSQGGMMSLHIASKGQLKLGGYLSIAGALVAPQLVQQAGKEASSLMLAHGQMDQVVPFAAMARAETAFTEAGHQVSTIARPLMGHGIDQDTVEAMIGFFKSATSKAS